MKLTYENLRAFAHKYGIYVERRGFNDSPYFVFRDGSVEDECRTLNEVLQSIYDFMTPEQREETWKM